MDSYISQKIKCSIIFFTDSQRILLALLLIVVLFVLTLYLFIWKNLHDLKLSEKKYLQRYQSSPSDQYIIFYLILYINLCSFEHFNSFL